MSAVRVSIGKPQPFPENEGYYCPFLISGVGRERIKCVGGVDAIQSLQLAMQMIGADLEFLRREKQTKLEWKGDPDGGLGFPTV